MDRNPRKFILTVTEVDAQLLPHESDDQVLIVFAGKIFPRSRQRLIECIMAGNLTIDTKRLL